MNDKVYVSIVMHPSKEVLFEIMSAEHDGLFVIAGSSYDKENDVLAVAFTDDSSKSIFDMYIKTL